jgi:excisionase family DNA binding protein
MRLSILAGKNHSHFMENPFEIILERLNSIETLIREITGKEKVVVSAPMTNEIFDAEKASDYLSLKKSTLYKLTAQREIPHYKNGKKLYFKRVELDEWITTNRVATKEEINKMATEYLLRSSRKGRRL